MPRKGKFLHPDANVPTTVLDPNRDEYPTIYDTHPDQADYADLGRGDTFRDKYNQRNVYLDDDYHHMWSPDKFIERTLLLNCFTCPNPGTDWTRQKEGIALGGELAAKSAYIDIPLKEGDRIVDYKILGDVTLADAPTVDAQLYEVRVKPNTDEEISETAVAGGAITQVAVNGNFDSQATLTDKLIVKRNCRYVIKVTGTTTDASDAIIVTGVELKYEEHIVGRRRVYNYSNFDCPAPSTDWTPSNAGVTLAASKTSKSCWARLSGLRVGDEIVDIKALGRVNETTGVTLTGRIYAISKAGPLTETAKSAAVSIEDAGGKRCFATSITLTSSPLTIAANTHYLVEITGTTGAGDTVTITGIEVHVDRTDDDLDEYTRVVHLSFFEFPAPSTDWTPARAGAGLAASKSAKKKWAGLPIQLGEEIVSATVVGDSVDTGTTTYDLKAYQVNKADPLTTTDLTNGAINQVAADGDFANNIGVDTPVIAVTDTFYGFEASGTTAAANTFQISGIEVHIRRKRTTKRKVIMVRNFHVVADWVQDADFRGVTLAASKTAAKVTSFIEGLELGSKIIAFRVLGDVTEASAVTVDAALVETTLADPIAAATSLKAITQIDANGNFDSQATLDTVAVVTTNKQLALECTATTGASDAVVLMGYEVLVEVPC